MFNPVPNASSSLVAIVEGSLKNQDSSTEPVESRQIHGFNGQNTVIEGLFNAQNFALSKNFEMNQKHFESHIVNSREMMLSQAKSLNKTSRVIVMGPGLLEPLADLAARCGELILVNNDETSLMQLAAGLSANVSVKKMDFTNGLYDRMEDLIWRANEEKWSIQRFFNEMIYLFNTYRPTDLLEDAGLKNADFVISSLIATQFTVIAEARLQKFVREKLNMSLGSYLQNIPLQEGNKYAVAEHALCNYLIVQYSKCLAKMIKPNGMIYLSDTITELAFVPLVAAPSQLRTETMDPANLDKIEASYTVVQSKKWYWFSRPSASYGFEVKAYLLRNK